MELKTALDIIKEVAANFQGNLTQHQNIQTAIKTIEEALEPKKDSKK